MTAKAFFSDGIEWIQEKHAEIKIVFYQHVRRHPTGIRMVWSSGWIAETASGD